MTKRNNIGIALTKPAECRQPLQLWQTSATPAAETSTAEWARCWLAHLLMFSSRDSSREFPLGVRGGGRLIFPQVATKNYRTQGSKLRHIARFFLFGRHIVSFSLHRDDGSIRRMSLRQCLVTSGGILAVTAGVRSLTVGIYPPPLDNTLEEFLFSSLPATVWWAAVVSDLLTETAATPHRRTPAGCRHDKRGNGTMVRWRGLQADMPADSWIPTFLVYQNANYQVGISYFLQRNIYFGILAR